MKPNFAPIFKTLISKIVIFSSLLILNSNIAFSEDYIKITGSELVYPFVRAVAEQFSKDNNSKTPIVVEASRTSSAISLFCGGIGENYPDIINASRAMRAGEIEDCKSNGVEMDSIIEIKLGYYGMILANSTISPLSNLTSEKIFLALADQVPIKGKLVKNPYNKWSQIDQSLPDKKIVFYIPSDAGVREKFIQLSIGHLCFNMPEFAHKYKNTDQRRRVCSTVRKDGVVISNQKDDVISEALQDNSNSVGVLSFDYLQKNKNTTLRTISVDGVIPTYDNVINGQYSFAMPLFVYVKKDSIATFPDIKYFIEELVDPSVVGISGYLTEQCLIPLSDSEMREVRKNVLDVSRSK